MASDDLKIRISKKVLNILTWNLDHTFIMTYFSYFLFRQLNILSWKHNKTKLWSLYWNCAKIPFSSTHQLYKEFAWQIDYLTIFFVGTLEERGMSFWRQHLYMYDKPWDIVFDVEEKADCTWHQTGSKATGSSQKKRFRIIAICTIHKLKLEYPYKSAIWNVAISMWSNVTMKYCNQSESEVRTIKKRS